MSSKHTDGSAAAEAKQAAKTTTFDLSIPIHDDGDDDAAAAVPKLKFGHKAPRRKQERIPVPLSARVHKVSPRDVSPTSSPPMPSTLVEQHQTPVSTVASAEQTSSTPPSSSSPLSDVVEPPSTQPVDQQPPSAQSIAAVTEDNNNNNNNGDNDGGDGDGENIVSATPPTAQEPHPPQRTAEKPVEKDDQEDDGDDDEDEDEDEEDDEYDEEGDDDDDDCYLFDRDEEVFNRLHAIRDSLDSPSPRSRDAVVSITSHHLQAATADAADDRLASGHVQEAANDQDVASGDSEQKVQEPTSSSVVKPEQEPPSSVVEQVQQELQDAQTMNDTATGQQQQQQQQEQEQEQQETSILASVGEEHRIEADELLTRCIDECETEERAEAEIERRHQAFEQLARDHVPSIILIQSLWRMRRAIVESKKRSMSFVCQAQCGGVEMLIA
jgi:hypothetical protein